MPNIKVSNYTNANLSNNHKINEYRQISSHDIAKNKPKIVHMTQLTTRFLRKDFFAVILACIVYYFTGIAYFHRSVGFNYLDTVYYSVVTLTTVGYGDNTPKTDHDRLFTCFYVLFGVSICGTVISVLIMNLYESFQLKQAERQDILMEKVDAVAEVKRSISSDLDSREMFKNKQVFTPPQPIQRSFTSKLKSFFYQNDTEELLSPGNKYFQIDQDEVTLSEFIEINKKEYKNQTIELILGVIKNLLLIIVVILIGALSFMSLESLTFIDSLYWAVISLSTVGYGDIVPHTDHGKIFTVVFLVFGCFTCAYAVTVVAKYPLEARNIRNELKIFEQFGTEIQEESLSAIVNNKFFEQIPGLKSNRHQISRAEFVLLVLNTLGKVEKKDATFALKLFQYLDINRSGFLGYTEIKEELDRARIRDNLRVEEKLHSEQIHANQTILGRVERFMSSASTGIFYSVEGAASIINRSRNHDQQGVNHSDSENLV